MRSAGSRSSEVGDNRDGNVTANGPPLPAITGIAAWDSALLQEYHRRKRAEKAAAAAAAAAEAAEAAEASELWGEDVAPVAEASPSTPPGVGRREPETSSVTSLQAPGAASAAAATAATASTTVVCPQVAGAYYEEKSDGNDATASDGTDSTSTSSSDSGHEGYDPAQEQDPQDGDLDSLEPGPGHEVDGTRQHSMPKTDDGEEQDSQGDQGPDEQDLLDFEPQRMGSLGEGESPREGRKPAVVSGRSKRSPRRPRRRATKLTGLHGALELATRCLRKDGFNAKAYGLRAELEARLGRRDRAIADYRAAASLNVGDPRPRMNMVCKDARLRACKRADFTAFFHLLFSSRFLCTTRESEK